MKETEKRLVSILLPALISVPVHFLILYFSGYAGGDDAIWHITQLNSLVHTGAFYQFDFSPFYGFLLPFFLFSDNGIIAYRLAVTAVFILLSFSLVYFSHVLIAMRSVRKMYVGSALWPWVSPAVFFLAINYSREAFGLAFLFFTLGAGERVIQLFITRHDFSEFRKKALPLLLFAVLPALTAFFSHRYSALLLLALAGSSLLLIILKFTWGTLFVVGSISALLVLGLLFFIMPDIFQASVIPGVSGQFSPSWQFSLLYGLENLLYSPMAVVEIFMPVVIVVYFLITVYREGILDWLNSDHRSWMLLPVMLLIVIFSLPLSDNGRLQLKLLLTATVFSILAAFYFSEKKSLPLGYGRAFLAGLALLELGLQAYLYI